MSRSVLSLFSGAGGMDIGLARAGYEHVGLIEIGRLQRETIASNTDWPLLGHGDVNELALSLKPRDLGLTRGDLGLLAGGPPCQPFSMAAQWAAQGRRGMLDARAQTVVSTLKLVRTFLPHAVLFENVSGFVRGPRSAMAFLEEEFSRINSEEGTGYRLHVEVLNAADYGVPQNRRRAIVVALRDGSSFAWPTATHGESPRTAWDALWDVRPTDPPVARGKWTELLPLIPEGRNYLWLTSRGGGPELFGYRTKYWNFLLKLAHDQPSWTLPASPGPSTGPFHWENRPLAVEEQLRIQGFPDGWRIAGNHREQTVQVGNATPALLAEVLGMSVRQAVESVEHRAPSLLRRVAAETRRPREPLTRVPGRFVSLVGAKSAHAGEGLGPSGKLRPGSDRSSETI
ncbi:DNA cytosine methyltransferase [Microbacterium sp. SL75]|uniref:DNA cytosine methyltransferase n=1 Tax=Microbacterium sp. SL75 TaxID=2995140 RepID=UPI002271C462|nr:DNA cytosine methyltransferase [Microbacterium sp. SL75]WAC70206.1 DNA cytosine methyltransferase [Microbacterium sp. SL75]